MVERDALVQHCRSLLATDGIKDYCPNGLQVEGRPQIERLLVGVTACEALLEAAVEWRACAVLVHHGYFWRGEPEPLVGMKGRRVRLLMQHDINLLAYHLPLDVHPTLGNNAVLAAQLALENTEQVAAGGTDGLLWFGALPSPASATDVAARLGNLLDRAPLLLGDADRAVHRVAICSGGAQGFIEQAAAGGADLYLSGEASERTTHAARELGITYLAAGHHATERGGVRALGESLAADFDLEMRFVDIDNPV